MEKNGLTDAHLILGDGDINNLQNDGGDKESILTWVNSEYAKNGFVGMQARRIKFDKPISELERTNNTSKNFCINKNRFCKSNEST